MPIEPLSREDENGASLFESGAWQRVLENTYGFGFHLAREGDAHGLPFATTERVLRARIVSLPFSDYVLTDALSPSAYRELAETVREDHPGLPIVLKTTFPHDTEGLGVVTRKAYYHRVPTTSHETVESNLRSSFERGVRKARREDVTVQRATSAEALTAFLDLHRALRFGKFGKIPQPRRFFEEIRRLFMQAERGFVMQAMRHGEVIAALVALRHRDVLYYKFGASAKEHLGHRPNNLLMHELLRYAVDHDCQAVDLGLSGAGSSYEGLRRFKESFGGQPRPVTRFQLNPPEHAAAAEEEFQSVMGRLSEAVVEQDLDAEATDAFSEILYPYFA